MKSPSSAIGYRSPPPKAITISKGIAARSDFFLEGTESGIAGVIADASGQGLAAQVILAGAEDSVRLQTEGNGQFVFGGLSEGTYRLSAAKAGYAGFGPVEVAYDGKGIKTRNIPMTRRANLIQGVVRDALTNTPVAGALVALNGGAPAAADSLGRYEIDAAGSPASAFLDASMEGYLPRSGLAVFPDGDGSATQDIVLTADYKFDGEIAVTVTDGRRARRRPFPHRAILPSGRQPQVFADRQGAQFLPQPAPPRPIYDQGQAGRVTRTWSRWWT